MEPIKRLMLREMPLIPDLTLPMCDVRDVARSHILALKDADVVSQRVQIVSSTLTLQEFAKVLEAEFKSKGYSVPTRKAPNFLLKFAGLFRSDVAYVVPMLGKRPEFDSSRFRALLKAEPIEQRKTIIDMAYSVVEKGFIPKKF